MSARCALAASMHVATAPHFPYISANDLDVRSQFILRSVTFELRFLSSSWLTLIVLSQLRVYQCNHIKIFTYVSFAQRVNRDRQSSVALLPRMVAMSFLCSGIQLIGRSRGLFTTSERRA